MEVAHRSNGATQLDTCRVAHSAKLGFWVGWVSARRGASHRKWLRKRAREYAPCVPAVRGRSTRCALAQPSAALSRCLREGPERSASRHLVHVLDIMLDDQDGQQRDQNCTASRDEDLAPN